MRVIVPALGADCPAHLALTAEGVTHEVVLCLDDTDYSQHLVKLWSEGEGFIIVEHDVAPWAGAIQQLAECDRDWCMFRYMKHGGQLIRGLGCSKFSDRLVSEYPSLLDAWRDTDWRILDGAIGAPVAETLRAENPRHPLCTHNPPVAHVRRLEE